MSALTRYSCTTTQRYAPGSCVSHTISTFAHAPHTDCLREVNATLAQEKPFFLAFDPVRGGASLSGIAAECNASMQLKFAEHPTRLETRLTRVVTRVERGSRYSSKLVYGFTVLAHIGV